MLEVKEFLKENTADLFLEGVLVAGSLDDMRSKLKTLITQGINVLSLDMTKVTSVDSAGVGFLAAVHNSMVKAGGILTVCGLSKELYQFFLSLRLNSHFKIELRKE
jgi:anti-anti-sigma factor